MDNNRRSSKVHKETSKRDKKPSIREQTHTSTKRQTPKFGNLIPRNDELKLLATNVLGDYHSTVESIAKDYPYHNRLMGVDRSLPITPLPSSDGTGFINPFDQLVRERMALSEQTKATPQLSSVQFGSVSQVGRAHESADAYLNKPHPPTHPRDVEDFGNLRQAKKKKKGHHSTAEKDKDGVRIVSSSESTEHAQSESLPKPASWLFSDEEKTRRDKRLKKSRKDRHHESSGQHQCDTSGGHTGSTGSMDHVMYSGYQEDFQKKPTKLILDTSSLDATDLQSIKDMIVLPPFITPIHTPCLKRDNPFVFPTSSSSSLITSQYQDSLKRSNQSVYSVSSMEANPSDAPLASDILGNISSSDDSSSDSEESSDEEEEMREEIKPVKVKTTYDQNTISMLEQIRKECPPSLTTLTPLKTSPPAFPSHALSLLPVDEAANLSPAKLPTQSRNLITPIITSAPAVPSEATSSDSDTSSSDSDSESDTDTPAPIGSAPQTDPALISNPVGVEVTQPFDVTISAVRQTSKPFTFEPDDATPTGDAPYHIFNPREAPSTMEMQRSNDGVSEQKRRRHSEREKGSDKKLRLSDLHDGGFVTEGEMDWRPPSQRRTSLTTETREISELLIQIPLSKVPELQQKTKPQATVGPYRISSDHHHHRKLEPPHSRSRERQEDRFDRQEDSSGQLYRESYHGNRQRDRGWSTNEYDSSSNNRGHRGERWNREASPHGQRSNEEYWSYQGNSVREDRSSDRGRQHSPQYYYEKAKTLKREADSLSSCQGTLKAIRYMEAVAYFIRHGYSQETDAGMSSSNNSKSYKIYSDIVSMVKHCSKLGNDCKPLLSICLRCHSVLLWRMYLLKQLSVYQLQKELQEVFNTPSKLHQKSPVPTGSFSPLPSPASVGSTASSCSGPSSTNPAANSEQSLAINKSTCSKVMEYLSLTGYIQQGLELWRQSDSMIRQHKDFFNAVDRKIGEITQFSSISLIIDWMENGLQLLSRNLKSQ